MVQIIIPEIIKMSRKKTLYLSLFALLMAVSLSLCVLAEPGSAADKNKGQLFIGLFLIVVAFASYMKTEEGVFFVVFASQGITQILAYIL